MQIVESGSKNIEIAIVRTGGVVSVRLSRRPTKENIVSTCISDVITFYLCIIYLQSLEDDKVEALCVAIEAEKEAARAAGESKSSSN